LVKHITQYSDKATGLKTWVWFPAETGDFIFSTAFRPLLGNTQRPIKVVPRYFTRG